MKSLSELKVKIADSEFKKYVKIPEELFGNEKLFVAYADGNGMTGFGINDGDTLLLSMEREPKLGDVVMARVGVQVFMRQILTCEEHGTYILHADGVQKREDVETAKPEILGVLAYILKRV